MTLEDKKSESTFVFLLILLALGLGAYGLSSSVRSRVNDYVRALRAAHEAHREADIHLANAKQAPAQVDSRIDAAIAATAANQRAAQNTADAARMAQTEVERSLAADSAAKVLEREKRIEEALSSLGVGQCGVRSYERVTSQIKDTLLRKLHAEGMTVTGDDPWDIDTQISGVKLRAVWDPKRQVLKLIVTASSLLVPCGVIWQRIDGALRSIIGS